MDEDEHTISPRRTFGFAAFWAAGLCVLCVSIGEGARQAADSLDGKSMQIADESGKKLEFSAIDSATTGAIKGQTTVLSPCNR